MYGKENFSMLMSGVAAKTGYNIPLFKRRMYVQPNYGMAYTFVNTFNYTNAANVNISSQPLNAITIFPGIKIIGNLENGWQPYINVNMVWNIMDQTNFRANETVLPDLSVKPFIVYGAGLQKIIGDRFVGFFQVLIRNGGRNGVGLFAGVKWAF